MNKQLYTTLHNKMNNFRKLNGVKQLKNTLIY